MNITWESEKLVVMQASGLLSTRRSVFRHSRQAKQKLPMPRAKT